MSGRQVSSNPHGRSDALRCELAVSVHVCDYEQANKAMSREQKVATVEAYLDCFVTKNLSQVPFACGGAL